MSKGFVVCSRSLVATLALTVVTLNGVARATPLLFSYSNQTTNNAFSFSIDDSAVPDNYNGRIPVIDHVTEFSDYITSITYQGNSYTGIVGFARPYITGGLDFQFSSGPFGGQSPSLQLFGPALDSGEPSLPVFTMGASYKVNEGSLTGPVGTFTISRALANAVPELGTWLMMLVGTAVVGVSLRRPRKTLVRFEVHKG